MPLVERVERADLRRLRIALEHDDLSSTASQSECGG
jgi:hypothetical protein